MNFSQSVSDLQFCVYMHISPKGKRYIGITSQSPEVRWGKNGSGYRDNAHFYSAIQKYGWDSFSHILLHTNVDFDKACSLEQYYIDLYNSTDSDYGYNHMSGGQFALPNEETRHKISESLKHQSAESLENRRQSLIGHPVSDSTKQKISQSKSGKPIVSYTHSEEHLSKSTGNIVNYVKNNGPWNKGLTKETDNRVAGYSKKLKGKHLSEDTKDKLREAWKCKFDGGYQPVWINDGHIEKLVDITDLTCYIESGFQKGRLNRQYVYIHKGETCKRISSSEVDKWIMGGWKLGRSTHCCKNIKNAKHVYDYYYDDKKFTSAQELSNYLCAELNLTIVASTITSMLSRGKPYRKYESLYEHIKRVRVSINENPKN